MTQPQTTINFTLEGHAHTIDALRQILAQTMLTLANAQREGENLDAMIAEGAKFTLFDTHYHGELSLDHKTGSPAMHEFSEDEDPHDFDEFRAGHLGDTP